MTLRDGSEVIVRRAQDPSLPPGIEPGNTVREVIWSAESQADLGETLARLKARWPVSAGADGIQRLRDPNGMTIGFRVSKRRKVSVTPALINSPGNAQKVDLRSPIHERAYDTSCLCK